MGSEPKKHTQIGKVLKKKHDQASLVAQTEKNLPAMWETWVQSLGWKDPLEKEMATQYSGLEYSIDYIIHGVAKSQT